MGLGIVAAIDGAHATGIQFETADQIGRGSFAFHQAAAARLHFADEALPLFAHHIGAAFQRPQVIRADGVPFGDILDGAPEAFVTVESLVVDDQGSVPPFGSQHSNAVGRSRIDCVGLLQEQRSRCQLRQGPELHQDVGVEGGVLEGLGLVAEAGAQHPDQTGEGAAHVQNLQTEKPHTELPHLAGLAGVILGEGMVSHLAEDQIEFRY